MVLKVVFHLLGAIQFLYGCYYNLVYVNYPITSTKVTAYGGKFKYLTFLNAMLQTIYFTVAFMNDIFGSNEPSPPEKPLIRRIKDSLFCTLAFPISMFVGLTFWVLYCIDRELILPRSLDPYFPFWLNHVMHTNIVIFIFIDLALSFRMYPSRIRGTSILATFMVCYLAWVHFIYLQTGSWVYPVLGVLNWPLRVFFYVICMGLLFALYQLGESLNKAIWSKEMAKNIRAGKKKAK